MIGARWGWVAFIGAVAVLFAASKEQGPSAGKQIPKLRQELHALSQELDVTQSERNQARDLANGFEEYSIFLDHRLAQTQDEVKQLQAQNDKLRNDFARLSLDRSQLQQTLASLQNERTQTKRQVEQLRHGLQQLLAQSETVLTTLAEPAPGLAQIIFDEEEETPTTIVPVPEKRTAEFACVPLNKNQ